VLPTRAITEKPRIEPSVELLGEGRKDPHSAFTSGSSVKKRIVAQKNYLPREV